MLAAFTGITDLTLDANESAQLAKAIADVGEHYGMATVFDPKTVAWINLGQTVIAIYGTRILTIRLRAKIARDEARAAAQAAPQPISARSTNAKPSPAPSANIPGLGEVTVETNLPPNNFQPQG